MSRPVPAQLARIIREVTDATRRNADAGSSLLERFVADRDGDAFRSLVDLYAPLVWGVCLRTLRDPNDAEDAFQAAFIVLARKADRIARPDRLAAWMHGVALRVSRKVRDSAARRREVPVSVLPEPGACADRVPPDLRGVIDEELDKLPDDLRQAALLCYVEGLSHAEAARVLNCSKSTVAYRVGRASDLLRVRLDRRGLAPAGCAAGALAAAGRATAARAADRVALAALGVSPAGGPSAAALAAADEVIRGMTVTGRLGGRVVGLALLLAAGAGTVAAFDAGSPVRAPVPPVIPPGLSMAGLDLHGDPLPARALARIGSVRFRPPGGATDVAWVNGGRELAAADGRGGVAVLRTADGVVAERLAGPPGARWAAASADGRRLAVAGYAEVWCWDFGPTGREVRWKWRVPPPAAVPGRVAVSGVTDLAVAPNGRAVYCGDRGGECVRVIDAETGQPSDTLEGTPSHGLAVSAGGRYAAAVLAPRAGANARRNTVAVWDLRAGRRHLLSGPDREVIGDMALAPAGDRVAWVGTAAGATTVHASPVSGDAKSWPSEACAKLVAFTPDGAALAEFGWAKLVYRDPGSGAELRAGDAAGWAADSVAGWHGRKRVSPDGKRLALAGPGGVALYDVATGRADGPGARLHAGVRDLVFSPDGRRVVTAGGQFEVRAWDADTGRPAGRLTDARTTPTWAYGEVKYGVDGGLSAVGFRPGDAAGGVGVVRWAAANDLRPGWTAVREATPSGLVISGGGRWAVRPAGPDVAVVDRDGKTVRRLVGDPGGRVQRAGLSDDGRTAFAVVGAEPFISTNKGKRPPAVAVWDARTGRPRLPAPLPAAGSQPAISADGRWLATVEPAPPADGSRLARHQLTVWEVASGTPGLRVPEAEHPPTAVAFSADHRLLAVGDKDGGATVWDVPTGSQVGRFAGHDGKVTALAFSPDGRRLATGGQDCTGLVWDLTGAATPADGRPPEALWRDLTGTDPAEADRAGWALSARGREAVRLIAGRVPPAPPDPAAVADWVRALDAPGFRERDAAQAQLLRRAGAVAPAVRLALVAGTSAEARERLAAVLTAAESPLAVDRLAAARGVAVLERIGGPDATRALEELAARGDHPYLAEQATEALWRLGRRPDPAEKPVAP